MYLRKEMRTSTDLYFKEIARLKEAIEEADAILIGAGAGLSSSAGLTYDGKRFEEHFADFHVKYGISDMYYGGFYPFSSLEEYWAWWSRHIYINRYVAPSKDTYKTLLNIVKDKDYFVLTTNVDHQFQLAGFDKKRLFYTQGDYGLWQCSKPCHNQTYDNKEIVQQMVMQQKDMKIPSNLIPKCPICGANMTMNLRCDDTFVQDEGWYQAASRYKAFVHKHENSRILFLELGVGQNTPGIIKYPFWQMTAKNPQAIYTCINNNAIYYPQIIKKQVIAINQDIDEILQLL